MPPKYLSGSQKRKRKQKEEELTKSQAGDIHKFFSKQTQSANTNEVHVDVDANVEENIVNDNVDTNVDEDVVNDNADAHVDEDDVNIDVDDIDANVVDEDNVDANVNIDIFDPRNWDGLNPHLISVLVTKGPKRDLSIEKGPVDNIGRHFSSIMYTRILPNKEKCDREWLVYSKELDKMFCFCCKLFKRGIRQSALANDGFMDWRHAADRLKMHESSLDHMTCMNEWYEMRQRLRCNETIDKVAFDQFKKERDYWKQVIFRIIELVKFLAKYGLAFRGTNEKLYQNSNGNFLGLVKMLENFDPIMKEHVRRIMNDELQSHYLGHRIQNEIILLLGDQIKSEIIKKVNEAKYYSIILDCTPDISHQEQMTLIVRYVNINSNSVTVEESFLGFLIVGDTTGKGLFYVTLEELKSLGLDVDNMRGQGYDNGSNMKGKNQGVQRRFTDINPRAFYSACGCHSLNLALCDMANTCVKSRDFFGVIQRFYTIFANSTKRWQILKKNVKGITLKSLSTTRWESRVESVKPIRQQLVDIREALLEVRDTDNDAKIQSEAKSLSENEIGDFEFLVSLVIWFELLSRVNIVSKRLQKKDVLLDLAIEEIKKLIDFFKDYREVGLSKAIDEAKTIAIQLGVDPSFSQRRPLRRKRHFDETSSEQEVSFSPEENYKVNYFLCIVDQAIASLESRFDQYQKFENIFGFLFPQKLKQLDEKDLKLCCYRFEDALAYEEHSDIDASELYLELKLFETFLSDKIITPFDAINKLNQLGFFPNALIAYRVLLTIPVTVASAERSFSKLKLLKSYLRSSMSQDRLNGLAMISIENDILNDMDTQQLIETFATRNARRAARFG